MVVINNINYILQDLIGYIADCRSTKEIYLIFMKE